MYKGLETGYIINMDKSINLMKNINYATASKAELAQNGQTLIKLPSTAKRTRRSLFGVKPSINKKNCKKSTIANANEEGTGLIF